MKVSILREDNFVYGNGEPFQIDCSSLPSNIHAIQWYGNASDPFGEIEFVADENNYREPNQIINDFSPYQFLFDQWLEKKQISDLAKANK